MQSICRIFVRQYATAAQNHFKLVVIGAGCGGLASSSKFANKLPKGQIAIIDKNDIHIYQPGWTLAGAGIKTPEELERPQETLIPKNTTWIRSNASHIDPNKNTIQLDNGDKISYDYLIIATGIETRFDLVKGATEALNKHPNHVISMYSRQYVRKVHNALNNCQGGQVIFTFPNATIKCPGAPQKIMYLADEIFRRNNVRDKITLSYNTALPVIFGVKKYAAALMEVVKAKNIQMNTRLSLVEVRGDTREAIFENLDKPGTMRTFKFDLLHIAPPMLPFAFLADSKLTDEKGFVEVYKETLQHKRFPNIFAIGDCASLPTSKTAASIAASNHILFRNLSNVMDSKTDTTVPKYDGYTSCPLVTGFGKCILAEFDFDGKPLETFPFNQAKERRLSYMLKKNVLPTMYWNMLITGKWNGPGPYRKLLHLGRSN